MVMLFVVLDVFLTGATKMIADLELMLGFRLCMRWVWWFMWVFVAPALLTVRFFIAESNNRYRPVAYLEI